jgi:hypothetical protein
MKIDVDVNDSDMYIIKRDRCRFVVLSMIWW